MGKKKSSSDLGRRERQIMDVIYKLGEASVGDVLKNLTDPPSYSSVRTMIRLLETKGFLKHRGEGNKYIYSSTQKPETVRKSALKHLMQTFFSGSATDAVAAILGDQSDKLTAEDLDRLEALINVARKEGKK